MTFDLLVILLALAGIALWRRRRGWAGGFAGAALLLFLVAACGPLPAWLLERLQAPYAALPASSWGPGNNAIVLLTGDAVAIPHGQVEPSFWVYGRIARAAMLYRECRQAGASCKLLVSGGDPARLGTPLAVSYGDALRRLGVPDADLILESRSNTTWQNAQFARPLLEALGVSRVWLVSSAFHLRRGELYFRHFGIAATAVRGDYLKADPGLWPGWWNLGLTDVALHEYVGLARYRVYNALGWNAPPQPPLRP
ncbi:hypothetical protein ASG87_14275 [Frateuria sp. Soil773]|uniref:YdcF family protein n=1 Tax=Frateuria sp. Soil773 TaxID=1736407 RepID=UPI0006F7F969|nr:YdcF family protein [Frateuria sp. Soil773]KRE99554.1 hypothetical protein ASG87_14275 [Frateuria sp. Soil773]